MNRIGRVNSVEAQFKFISFHITGCITTKIRIFLLHPSMLLLPDVKYMGNSHVSIKGQGYCGMFLWDSF